MMIVSAMVAIEKKMPCIRKVSRPRAKPIRAPTTAAAAICTTSGAPIALNRNDGRVDADAEKRAGAEIHVTGIAAEDAPGDGEHDELQDHVAGKERILVADDLRHQQGGDEKEGRADPENDAVAAS